MPENSGKAIALSLVVTCIFLISYYIYHSKN